MKARIVASLSSALILLAFTPHAGAMIPGRTHTRIAASACQGYGSDSVTGRVLISGINETSGIVASRTTSALWIEEDSGNPTTIYAIDGTGARLATIQVNGAINHDWEDIALADHQIWLGDIGDNHHRRTELQAYWFNEPSLSATSVSANVVHLTYADRVPRNAEAMVVDPGTKNLFIFTKSSSGSLVFRTSIDGVHNGDSETLQQIATLPLNQVTAADLGPKGVIVKAGDGYLYRWTSDHFVSSALLGSPCRAPAGPGESIAFSKDDRGLYAIPEGVSPPVYYTPPS